MSSSIIYSSKYNKALKNTKIFTLWGPMGSGKSTILFRLENKLKTMPKAASKSIKIIHSYIQYYRENQPLVAAIIDKNLRILYDLSKSQSARVNAFFTIQKIVINYSVRQITDAISNCYKILIMHNGYYTETNIFSHTSRLKKLGLNPQDIEKYKNLLQASGWKDLKEDYLISCDASLYDCFHRVAARKRASKTGEKGMVFQQYRELNLGVIVRRPTIPTIKIDTSKGEADMGYVNALHNILTYVLELAKLL